MSFFDDIEFPDPPPRPVVERPPWSEPPRGVLPGYSSQRAVIFKSDDALLVVDRFLAYPTGFEFTLSLFLRGPSDETVDMPWELHRPGRSHLPEDFLRFGLQFGDGSKWTNLVWRHPLPNEDPVGPVVVGRGGGGGGDTWEMGYWVWPLPPEGDLTFVASWPVRGIPESRAVVDAGEIRARAEDAETIWER